MGSPWIGVSDAPETRAVATFGGGYVGRGERRVTVAAPLFKNTIPKNEAQKMSRKKRSDSTDEERRKLLMSETLPPDGVDLQPEEMLVWRQMVQVRDDWEDFDLILLAKVVKLEVKIREWWSMVDKSGPMIRNKRETLIENPVLRSLGTIQHQQLAIITKMRIMEGRGDARTLNQKSSVPRFNDANRQNVIDLIARPG